MLHHSQPRPKRLRLLHDNSRPNELSGQQTPPNPPAPHPQATALAATPCSARTPINACSSGVIFIKLLQVTKPIIYQYKKRPFFTQRNGRFPPSRSLSQSS
ncbi:MAG: hypothetical protein M5U34_35680 [Chloroflexi bacterium]|nr:hypothetical protein [Chloroflexota bacterium]